MTGVCGHEGGDCAGKKLLCGVAVMVGAVLARVWSDLGCFCVKEESIW